MSKYCGKCDLYDCFSMHPDLEERISQSIIYKHGNSECEVLDIKTERDLALYFPYIVWMMASDSAKAVIHIGSNDYIRSREIYLLTWYADKARMIKKRCKRKKVLYLPCEAYDEIMKKYLLSDNNATQIAEITKRIGYEKRKSFKTVSDIKLPSLDFYRNVWFEDLVNIYGYSEEFAKQWVWRL